MAILEQRIKEADAKKSEYFFALEKERTRWTMERENDKENYSKLEDQNKRLEREREKLKIENEKLKAEKKIKTHSFIGGVSGYTTKTYIESSRPSEEINKENVNYQA